MRENSRIDQGWMHEVALVIDENTQLRVALRIAALTILALTDNDRDDGQAIADVVRIIKETANRQSP